MLKKITSLFLICLLVLGFTSCCKDGVYHPKEKISKVYKQIETADKVLTEEWIWSGKELKQINFHRTIGKDYIVSFEYDGNRIAKMTSSEGEVTTFTYDHAKLISAVTLKDVLDTLSKMEFEHDGRFISKINVESDFGFKNKSMLEQVFLRLVTNDEIPQLIEEVASASPVKGIISYELAFEYEKGNVSNVTFTLLDNAPQKISYTYNKDYKNPFHYLLYDNTDYSSMNNISFDFNLSKNMPATESINDGKTTVEYTYEGDKFPTKEMRKTTFQLAGGSAENNVTYYYEYE